MELHTNDCHNMTVNKQIELFSQIQKALEENKDHKYIFGVVMDLTKQDYKNILPTPPTVRPMSELPEKDQRCIFLLKYRVQGQEWKTGTFKIGIAQPYIDLDDRYWHYEEDNYKCDATGKTIIGWLPLPNPNDIKL